MEFHLEHGEKITASVRKHWFVLMLEMLPFLFLAWLPTILPGLLEKAVTNISFSNATSSVSGSHLFQNITVDDGLIQFLFGMWLLIMWVGAFNTFTRYYLNQWIITTTRIVYIHQHGFFSREVSSFLLARVQDVTTDIQGIFATLIGYGTLNVETAGDSSKDFKMYGIPHPTGLRDLIMREIADLHAAGKTFHL